MSHDKISEIHGLPEAEQIELVLSCVEYAFGSECREHDFHVSQVMGHGYCISSAKYGIVCLYAMNKYRIVMYREANKLKQEDSDIPDDVVKSILRKFKITKLNDSF